MLAVRKVFGLTAIVVTGLSLTSCASAQDVADASLDPTVTAQQTQPTKSAASTGPTSALTVSPPPTPTATSATAALSPTEATSPTSITSSAATATETPSSTLSPTLTTAPTVAPTPDVANRPRVGNCYDTGKAAFQRAQDGSDAVSCQRRHTAETFAVFKVRPDPSSAQTNRVGRDCNARFQRYVGDSPTVSKLGLILIGPSDEQIAAGQSWIRCDVIELANYNGGVGLPRTGSVSGALEGEVPLALRGCARRWPKVDQPVHLTSCQQRHQAELIPASLNLGGPDAEYPGQASVKSDSKLFCANTVQSYVPEAVNYYYYFPKLEGWRSGTRETTCWALDRFGDGLPPI